jgi:hypothetical protein
MNRWAGAIACWASPITPSAQAPPSKQVEVFGPEIHYVEVGNGPTVTLLDGRGGDRTGYSLAKSGVEAARDLLLNLSTLENEKALPGTILANPALVTDEFAERALAEHMRRKDGYTIDRFLDSILPNHDVVDGKLGTLPVPTAIVWGREAGLIPLGAGQTMGNEITGSQQVIRDQVTCR